MAWYKILQAWLSWFKGHLLPSFRYKAQQSRGGNYFSTFLKILQKYETAYQMKAVYEISLKYVIYNHKKKWKLKILQNTACLTEGGIYEVKKRVKES